MLHMKLPVVDRIQPQSNKFATGVEKEDTGDSKLNGSPEDDLLNSHYPTT